ncbi:MAG: transposase [Deltaproteobacteria bacterium]|nr:transposase [Deltaproteobacteria bacterium]
MRRDTDKELRAVAKKKTWRAEDAEVALAASDASGKTEAAFCREHGIHQGRLSRWRRSLEVRRAKESSVVFHEVKIREGDTSVLPRAHNSGGATLEVATKSGHRIAIGEDFDERLLQRVLLAVESMPC